MRTLAKTGLAVLLLSAMPLLSAENEPEGFVTMEVKAVVLDAASQSPVVLLADEGGKRVLPIWVGLPEGAAIERELRKTPSERPMTHDLLFSILGRVRTEVKEVRVLRVEKQTYHASLLLASSQGPAEIDARPSDAIVLALKARAPIRVSSLVVKEQAILMTGGTQPVEKAGIRVQGSDPGPRPLFQVLRTPGGSRLGDPCRRGELRPQARRHHHGDQLKGDGKPR